MTAACKVKQNILTGKYDINKLLQLKRAQSEMTYTSEKWLRFCASPVMCVHTSSVLPPPQFSLKLLVFLSDVYIL